MSTSSSCRPHVASSTHARTRRALVAPACVFAFLMLVAAPASAQGDSAGEPGRAADPKTGKVPPVGNTVDVKNATYTNDIGDSQLSVVWTDPEFDASLHAVYYVRVIEIPTPRWTTYDAKALGVDPLPDVPATIQERAWSSPIWSTPDPKLAKRLDFYPGLQQTVR